MRPLPGPVLLFFAFAFALVSAPADGRAQSPPGKETWVVEVTTSGGLAGRGKGNLTVGWDGALGCTPPQPVCGGAVPAATIERLATLVAALAAGGSTVGPRVPCSDCYITTVIVRRRTADGVDVVSSCKWNDVEFGGVPEPWKRLYEEVAVAALPRRQP